MGTLRTENTKSQMELILEYMRRYGKISTFEAFEHIGCTRLPARISDLKEQNHIILTTRKKKIGRLGNVVSYCEYTLMEG